VTQQKRWHYWWPTLVWAGVIFWFSSQSAIATSQIYWQDFIVKKIAHLTVYAILAILLYRSFKHTTNLDRLNLMWVTIAVVVLYAISDEFHQSFTPGREPRVRDVVIDTIGAGVSLWVIDKRRIMVG